jgi:LacI family repressor for deo operon, udp, cdd, tsx, nupC, and nupG
LINYTSNIPERLAHHIARHRIPVIWINSRQPEDCAHPDDLGAGRMLTEHLLSLGHRRIAWVDLFVEHTALCHYSRHDRRAGYRQAMDAAGLPIRECTPAHEIPGSQCASVAAGLVSGRDRATAIACYSTIEASAVMRAATLAGLRLPEDLSIAVVDDHPAFLGVPMTTALLDLPALGRTAAELLMQRIAHPRQHVPPAAIPSLLVTGLSTTTCAP